VSETIEQIALIGCGQVGTSILLAMAQQGKTVPVTVYDTNPETEALLRRKFVEEGVESSFITFLSSIQEAVDEADLTVLATPISKFKDVATEVGRHAKEGSIITDTGSAKQVAIENIKAGLRECAAIYVPAHNGNGSQGAGPLSGSAGNILGHNSPMFLIHEEGENFDLPEGAAEKRLYDFWNDLGVRTQFITAEKHDQFFGQCSHFQHVIVFALMNLAEKNPEVLHYFRHAGTALRNMSRVALQAFEKGKRSSLVEMWEPILVQNMGPVTKAYTRFLHHFSDFFHDVDQDHEGLCEKLKKARAFRDRFDDPERREIIAGEIADLKEVPDFYARQAGDLTRAYNHVALSAMGTNLLLPVAIAYAQTMSAMEIGADFIPYFANPSFRDGTHPVTYDPDYILELLLSSKREFLNVAADFSDGLKSLIQCIKDEKLACIDDRIVSAQMVRNDMPPPRKNGNVRFEFERKPFAA